MVAGDIINEVGAVGAALSFQPAAGVEVVITFVSAYNSWVSFSDGVSTAISYNMSTTVPTTGKQINMKMGITNTHYISMAGTAGHYMAYSGIQIK